MPSDEAGVLDLLRKVARSLEGAVEVRVGVELLTGYVGDGGNPGSGMFVLGKNVGAIVASLHAVGLPFEMISPPVWQRSVGIEPRRKVGRKTVESRTEFKRRIKSIAIELFPDLGEVTLKTADALLIAEHMRRIACPSPSR
jgi:hypothetical protein